MKKFIVVKVQNNISLCNNSYPDNNPPPSSSPYMNAHRGGGGARIGARPLGKSIIKLNIIIIYK